MQGGTLVVDGVLASDQVGPAQGLRALCAAPLLQRRPLLPPCAQHCCYSDGPCCRQTAWGLMGRLVIPTPQPHLKMPLACAFPPQSDWILDDVVPASWRRHLPGIYGIAMSPLRLLSRLLGPDRLEKLDSALGITWLGLNHGSRLLVALPATAAAGALAAALARHRRGSS